MQGRQKTEVRSQQSGRILYSDSCLLTSGFVL